MMSRGRTEYSAQRRPPFGRVPLTLSTSHQRITGMEFPPPPPHLPPVSVPAFAPPPSLSPSPLAKPPSASIPLRVLVVDDDSAIRSIVASILQGAGFFVRCANDGIAAWDALCEDGFHLLISDHDMPRLSGVELIRRVRTGQCRLPIILISGRMPRDETAFRRLLEPGVTMEKPFTVDDLLANVHRLLSPDSPATMRASAVGLDGGQPPVPNATAEATFPTPDSPHRGFVESPGTSGNASCLFSTGDSTRRPTGA